MPYLRYEAKQFIKKNLTLTNCYKYYQDAILLQNKRVLGYVVDLCAQDILDLDLNNSIVSHADAQFWIQVFEKCTPFKVKRSQVLSHHASKLVYYGLCDVKSLQVDSQTFATLTDVKTMPFISVQCALGLLETESQFINYDELSSLTSFQERCIDALAEGYASSEFNEYTDSILQSQGTRFLSRLYKETLMKTKS
jgi:hypothetical protein